MKWIKKWRVIKSDGKGYWIVSLSDENTWGCSCPAWVYRRQECKHIKAVKNLSKEDRDILEKITYSEKL